MSPTDLIIDMNGNLFEHATQPRKTTTFHLGPYSFEVPIYDKDPRDYYLFLVNDLKFEGFSNDVLNANGGYVKKTLMDHLWYKVLKRHFARWNGDGDNTLSMEEKRRVRQKAHLQTSGYEGFDPRTYWEMQKMINSIDEMGLKHQPELDRKRARKERFRARGKVMVQARRRHKEEFRRGAVTSGYAGGRAASVKAWREPHCMMMEKLVSGLGAVDLGSTQTSPEHEVHVMANLMKTLDAVALEKKVAQDHMQF